MWHHIFNWRFKWPNSIKKACILLLVMIGAPANAQDFNFRDYLVLGVEYAEDLTSVYLEPLNEGLMYALTGGWNNDARVLNVWQTEVSLVTNGSFVPNDKLSRTINIGDYENLSVLGGGNQVKIPTILGSTNSNVTFVANVEGEEYQFDAPTGIGLFSTNWLPAPLLQGSVGLPMHFEASFRYFPKLKIDDAAFGVVGFGLKNQITEHFEGGKSLPVAISLFSAFTRLDAKYDFQSRGFITGSDQYVDGYLNTFLFETLISTKNPVWNLYGSIGYITGKSNYELKGTYVIETENNTLEFVDPFDVQTKISGLRGSLGGRVNINWFSINLDYTLQGYNNLSLGLNFMLNGGKSN
ncbi:DUF6588 family protein [Flagellimonas sp. GZD32]|uniref:DUF6588 family protein n=1 Tax=Flagellimonas cixiensis TaxID=3228750 RepID=UPI0035C939B0